MTQIPMSIVISHISTIKNIFLGLFTKYKQQTVHFCPKVTNTIWMWHRNKVSIKYFNEKLKIDIENFSYPHRTHIYKINAIFI